MESFMFYLNRADGVEARTWLPSGDQDRKLTPPPPTRWSGTQHSEATSQTWNTQTLDFWRYVDNEIFPQVTDFLHKETAEKPRVGLLLGTIIVVSIGEADKSRDPLGDQAMEVTGEWPGWVRTWAQPDEGLQDQRKKCNVITIKHVMWKNTRS